MRLQTKLILILSSLLAFVILSLGSIFYIVITTVLERQIGSRALAVAETVAVMPDIVEAFSSKDPSAVIQPIAERVRLQTKAQYIVVGNHEGIRYSHPLPERIGQPMIGGDNGPVLAGRSIISKAVGSMGPSIRGKTPILNDQGQVIGIVSVGFMTDDIERTTEFYRLEIIVVSLTALMISAGGAVVIARNVRRSIHGLEPQEIGRLYTEKQAILESIREGIIAVNQEGVIMLANRYALQLLQLQDPELVIGKQVEDVLPNTRLLEVIRSGQAEYDQEMVIGDHEVVVNRIPIRERNQQVTGAVSSFRSKSELYRLAEELSQVKRFADSLRAQTHEFSNKLYVISGLIQLGSYTEAVELIARESDVHQNLVQFIMNEIPDPVIGGLLIGKYNHAQELKLDFEIDPESSFRDIPADLDRSLLVTIIGNFVDNAMEAVIASGDRPERTVKLFLTDLGEDLIIECEDNGIGIPEEFGEKVFEKGFSSKPGEHRGIGLSLVIHAVNKLGGYLTFSRNPNGGTIFTAAIPKNFTLTEKERADEYPAADHPD